MWLDWKKNNLCFLFITKLWCSLTRATDLWQKNLIHQQAEQFSGYLVSSLAFIFTAQNFEYTQKQAQIENTHSTGLLGK